jgi:hypothetical protein
LRGKLGRALLALALLAVPVLGLAGAASSAPEEDRVHPVDRYTTEKAKALGKAHAGALRELNAFIYHCVPWVETEKQSIGFFRPKHIEQDERYLSIRIFIEQDPSPAFAALDSTSRGAAMFSRYVGFLLRTMTKSPGILADPALGGFITILEWRKQDGSERSGRPVHEVIAVYIPKPLAQAYLSGSVKIDELARRARVMGWDGEKALGELKLPAWDDNFVNTYKMPNYKPDPEAKCS